MGGRTVHATGATVLKEELGAATVGAFVEVRGVPRTDGSVDASRIEVLSPSTGGGGGSGGGAPTSFMGVISSLPSGTLVGDWVVGGRTVHVTSATRVDQEAGPAVTGASVEVTGTERVDGTVDATVIEVKTPASGGGSGGGSGSGGSGGGSGSGGSGGGSGSGGSGGGSGSGGSGGSGGAAETSLFGVVQSLPAGTLIGDWTIEGRTVRVTASTVLSAERGTFAAGVFVEAKGTWNTDGSLTATRIELHAGAGVGSGTVTLFEGTVELLPSTTGWLGDWRVSGKTVRVTATTRIHQNDGPVTLNALVLVKGLLRADGSVDASEIEVQWSRETQQASTTWILPSAARASGLNGSFFTTDLTITNTGTSDAPVTIKFLGNNRDGREGPESSRTIPAGQSVTIRDVLFTLFGLESGYGALRVRSTVSTLTVQSQTSTPGSGGTFGQGLDAVRWGELIHSGEDRSISGIRETENEREGSRTNLVLVNATESEVSVDVILIGATGSTIGTRRVTLRPLEMTQIVRVARELGGTGDVIDARVVLRTSTAGGAFTGYATVIDNATNDPRPVLPR